MANAGENHRAKLKDYIARILLKGSAKSKLVKRKWFVKASICLLHAVWMLVLSSAWVSLNLNLEIEENLVTWASIIKRNTFINNLYGNEVALDQYSFIDVSGAKKLIDRDDRQGNLAVTDRALLDSLFRIVRKHPDGHQFIICDVFFEKETPDDAALGSTVRSIPNLIFPSQYVGDSLRGPVIPGLPTAYSGYSSSSGLGLTDKFLKYNLMEADTIMTLPLKMYAEMYDADVKRKLGLIWINGRPAINTLVLDIRIKENDLYDDEGFNKVVPIGEVLALKNEALIFDMFIKGKIVVIGDFEDDLHDSIYGETSGALLIVNIFEAIRQGDIYLKFGLLTLILIGYGVLSYFIFYYDGKLENKFKRFSYPLIGTVGTRLIGFSFGLYLLSILAYFIFGIHLDILAMATYLSVVSLVKRNLNKKKLKPVILNLSHDK